MAATDDDSNDESLMRDFYDQNDKFLKAAFDGNSTRVRELLNSGQFNANVGYGTHRAFHKMKIGEKSYWPKGMTAVMFATYNTQDEMVRILVDEYKCEVNVKDASGKTALVIAAKYADMSIIQLLVENGGANLELGDAIGMTPLFIAVYRQRSYEIVEYLLSKGANVNAQTDDGDRPLDFARDAKVKELLLQHGAVKGEDSSEEQYDDDEDDSSMWSTESGSNGEEDIISTAL